MINLLPPPEKQALKLIEVQKRILVILVHFLLCLGFLALILFLLSYYISLKTIEVENMVFVRNQELETYRFQGFKDVTLEINQNLGLIQLFQQEEVRIGPFLEEIVSLAPSGLSFNNLAFRRALRTEVDEESGESIKQILAHIQLAGEAATREVLYSFNKTLLEQEHFKQIHFSPDSWAKPTDAHFTVSFEVIYKEIPL